MRITFKFNNSNLHHFYNVKSANANLSAVAGVADNTALVCNAWQLSGCWENGCTHNLLTQNWLTLTALAEEC